MASVLVLRFPGQGGALKATPFRSPWADGGDSKCGKDRFVPSTRPTNTNNPLEYPEEATKPLTCT